jgi:hypothetical protein
MQNSRKHQRLLGILVGVVSLTLSSCSLSPWKDQEYPPKPTTEGVTFLPFDSDGDGAVSDDETGYCLTSGDADIRDLYVLDLELYECD